jgi:hypothetical protein
VWLAAIERHNYAAASIQATLYNAHFDTKGVPWTAEDLLGRGDREKRTQEALKSKIATSKILAKSKEVPDWALEVERMSKGLVN